MTLSLLATVGAPPGTAAAPRAATSAPVTTAVAPMYAGQHCTHHVARDHRSHGGGLQRELVGGTSISLASDHLPQERQS